MEHEFLSEAEIGERSPGEWVLVKNAEFDEQWRVVRGIVAAHSPDREEVGEFHGRLAREEGTGDMAVLCFKPMPKDVVLLFPLAGAKRDV